jgi:hypothetical protein
MVAIMTMMMKMFVTILQRKTTKILSPSHIHLWTFIAFDTANVTSSSKIEHTVWSVFCSSYFVGLLHKKAFTDFFSFCHHHILIISSSQLVTYTPWPIFHRWKCGRSNDSLVTRVPFQTMTIKWYLRRGRLTTLRASLYYLHHNGLISIYTKPVAE